MTKETMTFAEETDKFKQAVDLFFSMNPQKRLWILLMLYLGKERVLHLVDNTEFETYAKSKSCKDSYWHVLAELSIDDINSEEKKEQWFKNGVSTRFIWADTPKSLDCTFDELVYGLDIDSNNLNQFNDSYNNISNRHHWEPTHLIEIAEIFISLSDEWYKEKALWAFDYIVNRIQNIYALHSGSFYQPVEITDLVGELLNAQKGSVYNPDSGTGYYSNIIGNDCSYYGHDTQHINNYINKINNLINNRKNITLDNSNLLNNWAGDKSSFDYIVSTPSKHILFDNNNTINFLEKVYNDTKERSVIVCSSHICSDRGIINKRIISKMVDDDVIESVILLPQKVLSSYFEVSIIVIDKKKANPGYTRFVDASDCYIKDGRTIKLDSVKIRNKISTDFLDIANHDIRSNGYRINPAMYFIGRNISIGDDFKIISLKEILKPLKLTKKDNKTGLDFKSILSKSNNPNKIVHSTDLIQQNLTPYHKCVSQDCLIVHSLGEFYVRYLETQNEDVYLTNGFSAYIVDTDHIYPIYLLSEFQQKYFLEQLAIFRHSTRINTTDFLKLKIRIPKDMEKQLSMAITTTKDHFDKLREKLFVEYQNKFDYFIKNQRQRKHAVSQKLNEILPSVEVIKKIIYSKDSINRDSIVSQRFGTTFIEYIEILHTGLESVLKMVDNFTSTDTHEQAEIICLTSFLEQYCSKKIGNNYCVKFTPSNNNKHNSITLKIAPTDLTQILDNLCSNAIKHGFSNPNQYDYEIRISAEVNELQQEITIKVANNGIPVSKSISIDKLWAWGSGHGDGIGCWQVRDIAEKYGGSVSYDECLNDPFASEFSIVLPINVD